MGTLSDLPRTFEQASEWLGKKHQRPICNNTTVRAVWGSTPACSHTTKRGIAVRYHSTDIVTFYEDGYVHMTPFYSVSTNERYSFMGLPTLFTPQKPHRDRVRDDARWRVACPEDAYPMGVPGGSIWVLRRTIIGAAEFVGMAAGYRALPPEDIVVRDNVEAQRRYNRTKRQIVNRIRPIYKAMALGYNELPDWGDLIADSGAFDLQELEELAQVIHRKGDEFAISDLEEATCVHSVTPPLEFLRFVERLTASKPSVRLRGVDTDLFYDATVPSQQLNGYFWKE